MEKMIVYPFDRHFLPLLRHHFYPSNWNILDVISPHGWGLSDKDAGSIDFGQPIGNYISDNFSESLPSCDSVLFTQSEHSVDFDSLILPKTIDAIKAHKNIHTTIELSSQQHEFISGICKENNVEFCYYSNNLDEIAPIEQNNINKINTPIVAIEGLVSGLNKFEVQILLHNYLISNGYNSLLISSRSYGSINECISIPNFMFSKKLSETEKIIRFNNFVSNLEASHEPDVIILGIPGSLLPFDSVHHGHFGVTPFEITRAVEPDATILCMYTENFTSEFINSINNICKFRFSSDITLGIMFNELLIFSSLSSNEDSKQMLYDSKTTKYTINSSTFPIYSHTQYLEAFEYLIDVLADNAETEVF